ncbi:BZ3500_MvSof-1268-A1-R1_Chr1-1g01240 [Microbotryum saponariae]|uniref:BZ3500_MvSof-1268-A1-R1_Chr1-1g01240 protein n=1 Tax=Microbotryum saponariae TaxID=289078 RepID=A0A2X0KJU5_9BASI|nr:BZ3500_MvSof-1268-A1-R1_Chr1-1g01240 [Microbotryum saponariae]SCZ93759.1 BZ3501_MvSof-1269-A2-R1_Chr1-1g00836 [Microbotryum saponariae]
MRDRDTPADRRERAQAQQKRKAANTKAADNKRRRLDVAVGVSQINAAKKQDAWQRHKAAKEQKEKYVQTSVEPYSDEDSGDEDSYIDPAIKGLVLGGQAEDPCDFSDNGQDEADSDEGEDLVGPTVVDGADGAATVAIVNKVATSIMDDDDESVIPGVTPQPKAQALQSSIAGQALRRNPPQEYFRAAYNIFLPQGGVDMNDYSFEAEDDFQNDLLYEIFVKIVAGIRKEKSAAFQWPKGGLDPNDNDHRELAFALLTHAYAGVRYAMQVLTPPSSLPESSDAGRNANVAKQTVALWHEFSATHYQGPVMAILRRRRREGSGPFYSEAMQVRVTNRVQNSVEVALLEEYRGPGVSRRGTSDEMRITAQRACDFEESLFT